MRKSSKKLNRQAGIALLTTLLLMILMSSLMVGFVLLVMSGQRLSGMNNDASKAFYAAEAGMEKLTADLGNLFSANYAPSTAAVLAIQGAPPNLAAQGISFVDPEWQSGLQN
jgi:Tfp pilus assembly protein PilX